MSTKFRYLDTCSWESNTFISTATPTNLNTSKCQKNMPVFCDALACSYHQMEYIALTCWYSNSSGLCKYWTLIYVWWNYSCSTWYLSEQLQRIFSWCKKTNLTRYVGKFYKKYDFADFETFWKRSRSTSKKCSILGKITCLETFARTHKKQSVLLWAYYDCRWYKTSGLISMPDI